MPPEGSAHVAARGSACSGCWVVDRVSVDRVGPLTVDRVGPLAVDRTGSLTRSVQYPGRSGRVEDGPEMTSS